ncbi:MAG: hypothetical protein ABJA16_01105 [Nakamurella sp.]
MTPPLFTVSYGDDVYLFGDGDRRQFGRDDDACAIPIWEEIRRTAVSKIAGELWCMDAEMWIRNVSTAHELQVAGPDGPPQYLPVRRPGERGAARSLPVPVAQISAPSTGPWELSVARLHPAVAVTGDDVPSPSPALTTRLGPVPSPLLIVAAALCRPVLTQNRAPASYDEVARALAITPRQARRRIEELVSHYRAPMPELSEDHRRAEPLYADVARLLVRRGCITVDDLVLLPTASA